jgi:hypothetical protein
MLNRLTILSLSEDPAWLLDLEPGQQYTGCDDCYDHLALHIDLADRSTLTADQEDQLDNDPDVISYRVYATSPKSLSPLQGIPVLPHDFAVVR